MISISPLSRATFATALLLFVTSGCGSKPLPDSLPETPPTGGTPNSLMSSGDTGSDDSKKEGWKLLSTKQEVKLDSQQSKEK